MTLNLIGCKTKQKKNDQSISVRNFHTYFEIILSVSYRIFVHLLSLLNKKYPPGLYLNVYSLNMLMDWSRRIHNSEFRPMRLQIWQTAHKLFTKQKAVINLTYVKMLIQENDISQLIRHFTTVNRMLLKTFHNIWSNYCNRNTAAVNRMLVVLIIFEYVWQRLIIYLLRVLGTDYFIKCI